MIENLIEDFAHSLGHWAYLLVAFMAAAETAAFLGFIAPGEFTIILGGVLAGEGALSIQLLIGIVWVSIVIGDSIGFFIGRRYGRNFLLKHGSRVGLHEERLQQVEDYFRRHGGKTIFFGRWVGFVRPLMPFTAGSTGMPYRRFVPYDVLSAGLFGATFTLLGYIFWRNIDTVTAIVGRGAIGLGILVALLFAGHWAFKHLRRPEDRAKFAATMERLGRKPLLRPVAFVVRQVWRYLLRPIWIALLRPFGRYVLAPAWALLRPPLRFLGQRLMPGGLGIELTTLVAIAAVAGYVFIAYTDVISSATQLITPGDGTAQDIARDIENGTLTSIAKGVSWFGQWPVAAVVLAASSVWLLARRRIAETFALVVGFGIGQATVYITKAAVERPRPSDPLVDVGGGSSYPSGHAATAVVYVALAVVIGRELRSQSARMALIIFAFVLGGAISLSRVYLRAHYLSDVSAGTAIGALAFALCGCVAVVVSYLRHNGRSQHEPAPATAPLSSPSDG
jgi:membrane protein DedA with SNARE-associated domain/membrane-associated phospholipid phosphatase